MDKYIVRRNFSWILKKHKWIYGLYQLLYMTTNFVTTSVFTLKMYDIYFNMKNETPQSDTKFMGIKRVLMYIYLSVFVISNIVRCFI